MYKQLYYISVYIGIMCILNIMCILLEAFTYIKSMLLTFPEIILPWKITLDTSQPPIQWVAGALSPGVKRQVGEAGYSPLSTAKV